MLKEFFLVDYNSINSFKEISEPLLDIATQSFLLIAAIFELFKGFIGKSNVETRITIFILAAISMTAFNQYNQKVLDISFETSDKILTKIHIKSMTKISDIMKSTPSDQIDKENKNSSTTDKNKSVNATSVLGEARSYVANNLVIAVAWLISVIAIGLSRILFTVIYYALIVLSPVIIFISVFPGYEGSLKAFWQAFIWCFLAPIVFSVIFVLMHLVSQKESTSALGGLESLINVLLYGIFLVGSFIMTYKISTSAPLSGFAEKASMVGAMTMAAPFTSVSTFTQSAIHSPLQTFSKSKSSIDRMQKGMNKLSKNHVPHSGIGDISKMSHTEIGKAFGDKAASRIHSHRAMNEFMGGGFGLNTTNSPKTLVPTNSIQSSTAERPANALANSNPAFDNRKFVIDPNTLEAKEVFPHTTGAYHNRKYEIDPDTLDAKEVFSPKPSTVASNKSLTLSSNISPNTNSSQKEIFKNKVFKETANKIVNKPNIKRGINGNI